MTKAKTCVIANCPNTARRDENLCAYHLHVHALQAEVERMALMIPYSIRELKGQYGPALENLLVALARLSFAADATKGAGMGDPSPSAGEPDKWAGRSQLDAPNDHTVTLRGAGASSFPRRVLQPRYRRKLQELADDIDNALNPSDKKKTRVLKPRCWRRGCRLYGKNQDVDALYCMHCGQPVTVPDPEDLASVGEEAR